MKYLWLPTLVLVLLAAPARLRADGLTDGIAAYEAKDYPRAYSLLLPLAEGGDAEAQFLIGDLYFDGKGEAQDYAAAIAWFTKAAKQGHARSLGSLGYMSDLGVGTAKDEKKALCLYIASAQRGYANAQWNLSRWYAEHGSRERENYWLGRAERQGQKAALRFLAEIWLLNPARFDKTKAYLYLLVAAKKGDPEAVERLKALRESRSLIAADQLKQAEQLAPTWREDKEAPPVGLAPVSGDCLPVPQ